MLDNRGYASKKAYPSDISTPIKVYFPFGEERERLKCYVFEQLNGDEAIKNAEILKKFREEATLRKYRQLHRISYSQEPHRILESLQPRRSIIQSPVLSNDNNYVRYANYMPQQPRKYQLIPAHKTPPPIFNYSTLNHHDAQKTKRFQGKLLEYGPSVGTFETIKFKPHGLGDRYSTKNKSQSFDIRKSYKDRAIAGIKQIARQRKNLKTDNQKQKSAYSTDSSEILQELEYKKQISAIQAKHYEKQLKKFKKYRKYLQQAQDYRF